MTTNVMVRDLDLLVLNATDSRRLEVVVDGLPLFGGSQLAVDTTLVCSLHSDGSPYRGAADTDGVVFPRARRRRELRYPELVGPGCQHQHIRFWWCLGHGSCPMDVFSPRLWGHVVQEMWRTTRIVPHQTTVGTKMQPMCIVEGQSLRRMVLPRSVGSCFCNGVGVVHC